MDGRFDFDTATENDAEAVTTVAITQATVATFQDIFIGRTFLCFVRNGTKRIFCPINGEMVGAEGDLIVFPPGSIVTLENRPQREGNYRADGVYFARDLVEAVFGDQRRRSHPGIQIVRAASHDPLAMLHSIRDTLGRPDLPPVIRRHRLMEPLLWLRHGGIHLPIDDGERSLAALRRLIDTDLCRDWRAAEVAAHFAMSEASFRRRLAKSGHGFSKIVRSARLEKGLALLQTTDMPVSRIALECGFNTPSHFADSFRKRFGIKPMAIRSAAD